MRALLAFFLFLPCLSWAGGVEQLKQFLEGVRTLRAEFSQTVVGKSGRKPVQSSGTLAVWRPGKLRWEIRKPYPQLMIGDGERFWIYDPELSQVTVRKMGQALGATPVAILTGQQDIDRMFTLKEGGESDGVTWVEAVPKSAEGNFDRIRMGFAGGELRAMELSDHFGQTTIVRLSRFERNPTLSAALFRFVPPAGVDIVGE